MKYLIQLAAISAAASIAFQAHAATSTTNSNDVSPTERAKIESVVHDYLLKKPEILVEALQLMQKKQYEEAEKTVQQTQQTANKFAKALFSQGTDPVAGNPNGKITIAEFFDYQCGHCIDMAPTVDAIIKANPDVRVVYKEFPIRGPVSEFAARAALAANKQGKYRELSHGIMAAKPPLTQEAVLAIAKNVGLNVDELKKDMADKTIDAQLKANMKLAQDLKLFGTPAFFVGKTDGNGNINYIPGEMKQEQLQSLIDQAQKS
jgi:protein-disulfide isomerase